MAGASLPSSSGESHLSANQLAALIDGALPAEEAERARGHLADCERCYAVFLEALALTEEAAAEPRALVVPLVRSSGLLPGRLWWAAAASLALGAGLAWGVWHWQNPAESVRVAELVDGRLAENLRDKEWQPRKTRAAGGEPELDDPAQAFELGKTLTLWRVGWLLEKSNDVDELQRKAQNLAKKLSCEEASSPADLEGLERALERGCEANYPEIALGKWAEAAWLALDKAQAGDFLAARSPGRRALEALQRKRPRGGWGGAVEATLEELAQSGLSLQRQHDIVGELINAYRPKSGT